MVGKRARKRFPITHKAFADAINGVGDPLIITDVTGMVVMVNSAAEKLVGSSQAESVGKPLNAVLKAREGDLAERLSLFTRNAVLNRENCLSYCTEITLTGDGGAEVVASLTVFPLLDLKGKVTGTCSILRDVTDKIGLQQAVLRAKKEWENAMDSISDLVAIVDQQGRIVRLNQSMARHLGVKARDAIGMKCCEAICDSPMPLEDCAHVKCMRRGEELTQECISKKLGGPVSITAAPFYDAERRLVGSIHVIRHASPMENGERALASKLTDILKHVKHLETSLAELSLELGNGQNCSSDQLNRSTTNEGALKHCVEGFDERLEDPKGLENLRMRLCVKPLLDQLKARKNSEQNTLLLTSLEHQLGDLDALVAVQMGSMSHVLTPKELQIWGLIGSGLTSKQIAEILGISADTVNVRRARIRKKLGLTRSVADRPN